MLGFLRNWLKPNYDPSRVTEVFQTFDETYGYDNFHRWCQESSSRSSNQESNSILNDEGIEHVKIFDSTTASSHLQQILDLVQTSFRKQHIDFSETLVIHDQDYLNTLFQKVLDSSVDQKLIQYFKSEYFIYWHRIGRTLPGKESRRSLLWHCDKGPSCHLKLMLYLNDCDEHGGNTEFFNRSDTQQLEKTGYLFSPVRARKSDLSAFTAKAGIKNQPIKWNMKAGEALIFEPSRVIHRGVIPQKAPRYVLTLCLLPSPIHWHEAFMQNKLSGISKGYSWHKNAQDISQRFISET